MYMISILVYIISIMYFGSWMGNARVMWKWHIAAGRREGVAFL